MPDASELERLSIVCALQNRNENQLAVLINLKQINPYYADDTSAHHKSLPLWSEASGMR